MSRFGGYVLAFMVAINVAMLGALGIGERERTALLEESARARAVVPRPLFDPWGNLMGKAEGASGNPGGPPANGIQYGQGYLYDRQTAAFRSALAGADTLTSVGILATTEFILNGRQTLTVSGRFSNASATAGVRVVWVWNPKAVGGASANTITGISNEITLTATAATTDSTGAFFAPTVAFDGGGAAYARIICTTAPSAGTFNIWGGSF